MKYLVLLTFTLLVACVPHNIEPDCNSQFNDWNVISKQVEVPEMGLVDYGYDIDVPCDAEFVKIVDNGVIYVTLEFYIEDTYYKMQLSKACPKD